jgi:predicted XRE-type DNA-binding protein
MLAKVRGLTQTQIVKKVGADKSTISLIFSKKLSRISTDRLIRFIDLILDGQVGMIF